MIHRRSQVYILRKIFSKEIFVLIISCYLTTQLLAIHYLIVNLSLLFSQTTRPWYTTLSQTNYFKKDNLACCNINLEEEPTIYYNNLQIIQLLKKHQNSKLHSSMLIYTNASYNKKCKLKRLKQNRYELWIQLQMVLQNSFLLKDMPNFYSN